MALGARPPDLVRMVMGESLVLVATGLVAGTLLAWAATQLMERFLFGVARTDPWATALAVTILAAVALAAAGQSRPFRGACGSNDRIASRLAGLRVEVSLDAAATRARHNCVHWLP